jgi:hypothetical protein
MWVGKKTWWAWRKRAGRFLGNYQLAERKGTELTPKLNAVVNLEDSSISTGRRKTLSKKKKEKAE